MPRLSCWFIRAALLHLGIGATIGALVLAAKGYPLTLGWAWQLLGSHVHFMVAGWLVQLTFGVAFWILPRLDAQGDRGRPAWAWASFGSLNAGVVAAALAPAAGLDALRVLAALLHLIAIVAFVVHAWPRVRPTPKVALPR
jgi:hypothetical protein